MGTKKVDVFGITKSLTHSFSNNCKIFKSEKEWTKYRGVFYTINLFFGAKSIYRPRRGFYRPCRGLDFFSWFFYSVRLDLQFSRSEYKDL